MKFKYCWRWFGPDDPISLAEIKQTGATGIVTSLHHLPAGKIWPVEEILKRKRIIELAGLKWSVVESVPVHDDIKRKRGNYSRYIESYKTTLQHLALCGVYTVCYNFMPVLDWTRTELNYSLPNTSTALRFDLISLAAFDIYILKRKYAEKSYSANVVELALQRFDSLSDAQKDTLTQTIIAGLPGGHVGFTLFEFKNLLNAFTDISNKILKENLFYFLKEVVPIAEQSNIRLCIHPDDPPMSLFGLPRVVSTEQDLREILSAIDLPSNGITFCSGSLGASYDNDLVKMASDFAERIHFFHLRSVQREPHGSFYEAEHLKGDTNIAAVMYAVIQSPKFEEEKVIPVRPDHGHRMLSDLTHNIGNPGYTLLGRFKGLSELKALEAGLRYQANFVS